MKPKDNPENQFVFYVDVNVPTPVDVISKLIKAVNKAHIGDTKVNIYDEDLGRYVANPELVITPEHKEAAWHAIASHRTKLKVTVDCKTGYFSYEIAK